MSKSQKKPTRLTEELLDLAKDMESVGLIDKAAHDKITMRHVGTKLADIGPLAADEVKALRERANMSQAVFASHLNVTVGYVSQLERGAKRPTGAALALLSISRCATSPDRRLAI